MIALTAPSLTLFGFVGLLGVLVAVYAVERGFLRAGARRRNLGR